VRAQSQERGAGYFVIGGIVAGLIAGMVMAMFMMITTVISGMGLLAVPEMIGQSVLKGQAGIVVTLIGLMGHMMNSAMFGVIWAFIWRAIAKGGGAAIVGGVIYGMAIWAMMTYAVLLIIGSPIPGAVPAVAWAIAHGMLGLVLGLWPATQPQAFTTR